MAEGSSGLAGLTVIHSVRRTPPSRYARHLPYCIGEDKGIDPHTCCQLKQAGVWAEILFSYRDY